MRLARARTRDGEFRGLLDGETFVPCSGDLFSEVPLDGTTYQFDEVKLLAPVLPRRVLVILFGFLEDGEHRRSDDEPRLFPKVVNEHLGPDDCIATPPVLQGPLLMEAELALVVGKPIHRASPEDAWNAIGGFTVYNDVTAAEFTSRGGGTVDLYRAKSMDGFSVIGPWVSTEVSREQVRDGLAILGRVNGTEQQRETSSRFKFDPGEVLSHASQYVTLRPGDLISLGTPPPAPPISPGDVVEAEVEGLGVLRNEVK